MSKQVTIQLRLPFLPKLRAGSKRLWRRYKGLTGWKKNLARLVILLVIASLLLEVFLPAINHRWEHNSYALSDTDKSVISTPNDAMGELLKHDTKSQTYNFNTAYSPLTQAANQVSAGGAQIKGTLHEDVSKGVTITDPMSENDLTITPQLDALPAQQTKNQVQYPIYWGAGSLVYTAAASGIKEDILLRHSIGDSLKFDYKLGLGDEYDAKLRSDGSLAIYAGSVPLGNVSTSNQKDADLLTKARKKAKKDQLTFLFPAPVIYENGGHKSSAKAHFELKKDILTIVANKLDTAQYPLSIDPTVQISTTSEFYRNTSIESNADFDTTNNRITRGTISGGTTGTWTATTTMNQARFLHGATAYNGYVYVVGGSNAASTTNLAGTNANMVEYASISTANPSVIGSWSAGNNIGLPAGGLSRFQLIGYHGFIYAIGGSTTDTTCNTRSTTVYYAAVQVNGVLGNWSTTNAPTTSRCDFGAAVYGGNLYVTGGKTASTATGTTDVSYATVNPDGTLTWTNAVSPALPAARYGADLQAYNGYLYLVGGNLNGTLTNTVLYVAINASTGALYGSWTSTNNFTTARENIGGSYSVIRNGYIYVSGGCSVLNGSQTCTTVQSDNQLAQVNADGSLGQWATTTSLTAARVGAAAIVWRGTLYSVGGCAGMNAAAIYCTTALATTQYGAVSTAGQASVLKTGANTLPISVFGSAAAVLNGYLYVVGGCIVNDCQTGAPSVTNQTYYALINADGTLASWQNNAANTINGTGTTSGLSEISLVAANGSLYGFGGYNDSAPTRSAWVVTPSASTGALPGAWTQYTNVLPATAYATSALYVNGYFMIFGGCIAANGSFGCSTYRQTVSRVTFNGTAFSAVTALTAIPTTANYPNAAMGIAYYYGRVYLCGGAAAAQGQTQYCAYNTLNAGAGTLGGSWSLTTGKINVGTSPDHPIRRNAAYASNGYLYVYAGHDGVNNTPVGSINIGQINPSTGDVSSDFTVSTTAFTAKWDTASAFANGNIYTVGGCSAGNPPTTCSTRSNSTEYFQIYNATNSGTRNATSGTSLPSSYIGSSAAISNGYLYVSGGCSSYTVSTAACATSVTNSYYMALNPDGTMSGSWTAGPALPAARSFGCLVGLNDTLYYVAGANAASAANDVYFSAASGSTWGSGSWAAVNGGSGTGKLPASRLGLSCAVWNNRIYATGGSAANNTYYSPSLPSGGDITGAWTGTTTTFTTSRSYHSTVAAGGYLYVMGGYDGTNYMSDVQFAQIASSGDITATWGYTNDIPYKVRQGSAFAANGYIYFLGGAKGAASTSCLDDQYVASINSDGTLGAWTQGAATSFSARAGQATAYDDGYYYVVGGNDCTSNIATASVGGEQSQAVRSIFTRYIDFVGDATPQKFVVNGTNAAVNSVDIEKWRMTYASSRVATNAFGANTVLTPLSFGSNPVAITAKDGSSTNQGVSRYWLLTFDIDQTQSFTFTDTTQPNIISYSFYYSPSGGTRLRNGRIFQDQTKQSLDAHP